MQRIWHPWHIWECFKAGFYSTTPREGLSREECLKEYAKFLSSESSFQKGINRVFAEWPTSCEHFLSNVAINRVAWLGQAAMCIETGISSFHKAGFKLLGNEEQRAANTLSQNNINWWVKHKYKSPPSAGRAPTTGSKVQLYIEQWGQRGYSTGIPDDVPDILMQLGLAPSYKAIAHAILKNDLQFTTLGFAGKHSNWYDVIKCIEYSEKDPAKHAAYQANIRNANMIKKIRQLYVITSKTSTHNMAHYIKIDNGQCTGTDLAITLSLFIPELSGISCCVTGEKFLQALTAIDGVTPTVKQKDSVLEIVVGKFKSNLPVLPLAEYPEVHTPEKGFELKQPLLPIFTTLAPFMHNKPQFANISSINLSSIGAQATNGVNCARIPMEGFDASIIIPASSVNTILKNGIEPTSMFVAKNKDGAALSLALWINATDFYVCNLVDLNYPNTDRIFQNYDFGTLDKIPEDLKEATKIISKFAEGDYKAVSFSGKSIFTTGSNFELENEVVASKWGADHILDMLTAATRADFTKYPAPCPWSGENGLQGVIVGLKKDQV